MQDTVPLSCPKCRQVTRLPIRWVQENVFYTCPWCGASVLIDKDEATKALAAQQRPR